MRDAKARLEQLVPAYRQLALQLQLLDEFMARHGADVGPVVERTSEYFARLTCGEWDGVERVYGEGGTPEFFAVHSREPEQSFVALDDLSEGTRDQLFLALRLAYLVEHAHRGERIPFIADDILPSSDNERAAATMSLFADVSERFQVIVFTHHAHLTGIAEEAAGERVQTHDLPRFGAFVQAVEDAEVLA
jgi:uncharacterized protein YhaN